MIINAKVKVLRSLRRIDYHNVREKTVRGQYTSGSVKGKKVAGYKTGSVSLYIRIS